MVELTEGVGECEAWRKRFKRLEEVVYEVFPRQSHVKDFCVRFIGMEDEIGVSYDVGLVLSVPDYRLAFYAKKIAGFYMDRYGDEIQVKEDYKD